MLPELAVSRLGVIDPKSTRARERARELLEIAGEGAGA